MQHTLLEHLVEFGVYRNRMSLWLGTETGVNRSIIGPQNEPWQIFPFWMGYRIQFFGIQNRILTAPMAVRYIFRMWAVLVFQPKMSFLTPFVKPIFHFFQLSWRYKSKLTGMSVFNVWKNTARSWTSIRKNLVGHWNTLQDALTDVFQSWRLLKPAVVFLNKWVNSNLCILNFGYAACSFCCQIFMCCQFLCINDCLVQFWTGQIFKCVIYIYMNLFWSLHSQVIERVRSYASQTHWTLSMK